MVQRGVIAENIAVIMETINVITERRNSTLYRCRLSGLTFCTVNVRLVIASPHFLPFLFCFHIDSVCTMMAGCQHDILSEWSTQYLSIVAIMLLAWCSKPHQQTQLSVHLLTKLSLGTHFRKNNKHSLHLDLFFFL